MIVFLILMSPVVTFLYVVLKGDYDNVQNWKEYRDMKNKMSSQEKKEKARRFFGL